MFFPALLLFASSLPDTAPSIHKPAQPSKFIESVGRRSAILGREDGTFEAWINPIKVVRDFKLSVYFDGALEPLPLADLAESVVVSPGRVTIVHQHAAFAIRQTWLAPLDQPALIVLLEIDTAKPLKIRASFLPEFKPMWPASFGGQSSYYDAATHAFVFGEGLRRHRAVLGSPAFARASEQVGHQLPDRTMLAEMDVDPATAKQGPIPIVIAGTPDLYRKILAGYRTILDESDRFWRDFDSRTLRIDTPSLELNNAFAWAKVAMEKGWACNDGVGCGLVAGYGPSGASERPGFAWYFGGDAAINLWSITDYGDFPRVRAALDFLRDHQRADGKMQHELTQSAALLDWSQYPYGYYHGDTTPLYLFASARYFRQSGDQDFVRKSWDSLARAYSFCLSALDADGLMSNRKAGTAAVETGALSGKVEKDVYLAGAWLAALDGYATLAAAAGQPQAARDASSRLEKARAEINRWFVPNKDWLAFGRLAGGGTYEAQSGWQALALAYGGLDGEKAVRAAAALSRKELSTSWGVRLFATDSPFYDPVGYNDGSVWPFVTGFATMAEFNHHLGEAGLARLNGVAWMTGASGAGFVPENFSGDRPVPLPRSVPHQLFSSSAVLHPLVSGLFGLSADAPRHSLTFEPHLPRDWKATRFSGYRVGDSVISGEVIQEPGETRVHLEVQGPPVEVILSPSFPAGAKLSGIRGDGVTPIAAPSRAPDLHIPVSATLRQTVDATWNYQ